MFSCFVFVSKSDRVAHKDISSWDPHTLLVGMDNGAGSMGNSWAVPQKAKHKVSICSMNPTSRYVPRL